eukprot:jgi/Botrbrau1/2306/Bobra.101_2s0127.1
MSATLWSLRGEYAGEALGILPGTVLSALVWLQASTGVGFRHWNFFIFSVARCNGLWFLGLFGVWLPIPISWLLASRDRLLDFAQCASAASCGPEHTPSPLQVLLWANFVLFICWQLLPKRWMVKHWEVSSSNAGSRPWTFVTASLSHESFWSLAGNTQMVMTAGPALQEELGAWTFVALYLIGGAVGNAVAYYGNVVVHRRLLWSCKGGTAAVYALIASMVVVHPYRKLVWLFGIELNSLGLLAAKLAIEFALARMERDPEDPTWQTRSNAAGAVTGLLFSAVVTWSHDTLEWRLPKTLLPANLNKFV